MATLIIRDVPDDVVARIERVADKNGRTIEEEIRELLITQYSSKQSATYDDPCGPTCNSSGDG